MIFFPEYPILNNLTYVSIVPKLSFPLKGNHPDYRSVSGLLGRGEISLTGRDIQVSRTSQRVERHCEEETLWVLIQAVNCLFSYMHRQLFFCGIDQPS